MPRRKYTARERAKATGIGIVEGVTEAERQTGIPKETIQYWTKRPEFAQLRTTAREVVADQFWAGIQIGFEQVVKGLEGDAPLKEKAMAFGVIYDRHALLTGGATGRTESRELTDLPDSAYVAAIHEWRRISERSGEDPDPTPAEESTGQGL